MMRVMVVVGVVFGCVGRDNNNNTAFVVGGGVVVLLLVFFFVKTFAATLLAVTQSG